jgi:methyl-accepting chemotaxis protein
MIYKFYQFNYIRISLGGNMKKRNSIRTKLVVSVMLLIIFSILTLSYFVTYKAGKMLMDSSGQRAQSMAQDGARLIENRINSVIDSLKILSAQEEILSMNWEKQRAVLTKRLAESDFLELGVVSPDGTARYTDGLEEQLGDRDYIKKAFSGEANISDVIISRITGKPVTMIAVPIVAGKKVIGVLIGRREESLLSSIIEDIKYGEKGSSYMINSKGTIVAHTNQTYVIDQFNPISAAETEPIYTKYAKAIQTILEQENGGIQYNSIEDENKDRVYAGFAKIPGTDWIIICTYNESEIYSPIYKLRIQMQVSLVIGIVILLAFVNWYSGVLVNPIITMSRISEKISNLDLTMDIPKKILKGKDEIAVLANAMQKIKVSFHKIIEEVTDSALQVSATAQQLTATSEQSVKAADEVSKTVEEIAKGASEQASHTESGSDQASLLGNYIEKNREYVYDVIHASDKVVAVVKEGIAQINHLSKISEENGAAAQEINDIIQKTKESTVHIGEASSVIAAIARQTNLLALNASIEAARVGELGKGFAVVASEIKKLAGQSADSTRVIDEIINELQENVAKAVETMGKVKEITEEQAESVIDTKNKYEEIDHAMNAASGAIQLLSSSEEEMIQAKNNILDMLQTLSAIAEENAASTEEASSAMLEQTASMEEIAQSSERLTQLAVSLQELIHKFSL